MGDTIVSADWHLAEKAFYENLSTETKRKAFLVIRGWTEFAAEKKEPDFRIAQKHLAKKIGCEQSSVCDIVTEFRERGAIQLTAEALYKQSPARYRWTLETTIPVPAMPKEEDQESEIPEPEEQVSDL